MKRFLYFTLFIQLLASCNNDIKFDKNKWQVNSDGFYIHRDKMIDDLFSKHDLSNLTYDEIINLLGKPENYANVEENEIYYNIVTDYGWNIDPVYTKNLKIQFDTLNKVKDYKIEEIKNELH